MSDPRVCGYFIGSDPNAPCQKERGHYGNHLWAIGAPHVCCHPAALDRPGLDVEVLERAMANTLPPPWADQWREVAAEYARLAEAQQREGAG